MNLLDRVIRYCLENKLVVILLTVAIIAWGLMVAPFDWNLGGLPRDPVPVDAIPDIGENQQIVFTPWMGRSPQDVEDQITYPLTVSLLGIPGVKTIRSYSFFGFSSIYVIFKDDVEFYWSSSTHCHQARYRKDFNQPWDLTPLLWGRYSGIRWRGEMRTGTQRGAGTCMNFDPYRIGLYVMPCNRPTAFPKLHLWAVFSRNTKSTSIRTPCELMESHLSKSLAQSGCQTSMWVQEPLKSTRLNT
jgi:hypothetical protein